MQDNTATMITTLSTTMGLVFREGQTVTISTRQTNSGVQFGTLIEMGYDVVFIPIERRLFKWEGD